MSQEQKNELFIEDDQRSKAPYGDYWVSSCSDSGIERYNEITGRNEICEGYYCQVYDDPDYENQADDFCLAVGYEIADSSEEELERGIRDYLGCPLEEDSATEMIQQM